MYSNNYSSLNTRTWAIEKYQRLEDVRNAPMAVEKKGSSDLIIQVNVNLKVLSISHNGCKLEEFCFQPVIYQHDVVCKELRVVFTTKSQADGRINGKFRVRFRTIEACQNFCAFFSSFIPVTMYDEVKKRESNSFMNTSTTSNQSLPNIKMFNNSATKEMMFMDTQLLNETQQFFCSQNLGSTQGTNGSSGMFIDHYKDYCEASTQTDYSANSVFSKEEFQQNTTSASSTSATPSTVNINIQSLISDEAVQKLVKMCEAFFQLLFAAQKRCTEPMTVPPRECTKRYENKLFKKTLHRKKNVQQPSEKQHQDAVYPQRKKLGLKSKPTKKAILPKTVMLQAQPSIPTYRKPSAYNLRGAAPVVSQLE